MIGINRRRGPESLVVKSCLVSQEVEFHNLQMRAELIICARVS